jgi:NAD(P)-dependent dehydrogenase (short-subunit alcohol dehydrogenase family)
VTIEQDVEVMITYAVTKFGRLDCLVNNAGTGSQHVAIADVDLERFDATIAVHVRGVLTGMKYAVPVMAARKGGSIINSGALTARKRDWAEIIRLRRRPLDPLRRGRAGREGHPPEQPFARADRHRHFRQGAGLQPDEADENPEYAEAAIAAVLPRWQPLPYVGRADAIAQAALFLASDAPRMVTSRNLVVDDGITAGCPVAVARDDIALFRRMFQASHAARSA